MEKRIKESLLKVVERSVAGYPVQQGRGTLITYLCQPWARYWNSRIHCLRESGRDSHKHSPLTEI